MEPSDQLDRPALRHRIKQLILRECDVKGISPEQVDDEAILFAPGNAMGLTSLDAIEIAVGVEREFNVKLTNMSSAREYFRSVSSLSAMVERQADPGHLRQLLGR